MGKILHMFGTGAVVLKCFCFVVGFMKVVYVNMES